MNAATLHNPKVQLALAVAGGLLLTVVVWMLLISPTRAKATTLSAQITDVQSQIATRKAALKAKPKVAVTRPSDLYRLTKAIPDQTDMGGIIFDLTRLSSRSGVELQSVTPSPLVTGVGYNVQPIGVTVQGRYSQVSRFLHDLRKLVTVRHGHLDSRGRLFTVDNVSLGQGESAQLPMISADLTIDAFVFAGGTPATTPATGVSTSTAGTQTPAPAGAAAAGATP